MTATASEILEEAALLLGDSAFESWPKSELLGYLNQGIQKSVRYIPSEFGQTYQFTLVEGVKQTLDASLGHVQLMDVSCVIDGGGDRGKALFLVDFAMKNQANPDWRSAAADTVREVMADPREHDVFWVSPPANASDVIEILVAVSPTDIDLNDTVPVSTQYHAAYVNYIAARALSKDDEMVSDPRAQTYLQEFYTDMGVTGADG